MNIKKPLLLLAALAALGLSFVRQPFDMAKADGENRAWLDTQEDVIETNSYYAGLYLNTHEEISALSVEVHFNPNVAVISSTYNEVANVMYDSSIHEESITYTYIFDSFTLDSNQRLFYFYYQVVDGITPGRYYFDIIISEAYNSSLESVSIETTRKYIDVSDKSSIKTSNAYLSGSSSVSTSYNETFSFTYRLNNSEPTSGSFVIHYDDTLFEFVSFTKLNFFDNMICDYNASAAGKILVSFAEVTQDNNTQLFTVTLRVIKNETVNSQISLTANELYDTDMNPMGFTASKFNVSITYDSSYEEKPAMTTTASVNTNTHQVVFTINLEADSHLGAGDFILSFDRDVLTYVEYEKLISPTFFSVNDKESQLEQGRIKFSILSTSDIITGSDILTVTFSYNDARNNRNSSVTLTGSGLTDSLTNPIELDISGSEFTLLGVDLVVPWIESYLYVDDPSFAGEGSGRCIFEGLYETAKRELLKLDAESVNDFETNLENRYTAALARYTAWANANGDTKPFEANYDFLNASSNRMLPSNSGSNPLSVVVLVSVLSLITIFGVIVITINKKRKEQ